MVIIEPLAYVHCWEWNKKTMATPFCLRSHAKHVHTASSSVTNFAFAPLSHTTQKPDNQATIIVPANVVIETGKCVCVCVCLYQFQDFLFFF